MRACVCPIKNAGIVKEEEEGEQMQIRFKLKPTRFAHLVLAVTDRRVHSFGDIWNWKKQKKENYFCQGSCSCAYIWNFCCALTCAYTYASMHVSVEKEGKAWEHGGQFPKGILCACVCVHACVFLFCSYSVLSHRWAGHADRNRVLGGPATGAPRGTHWACSEKHRKGISCCDRTEPGTLVAFSVAH